MTMTKTPAARPAWRISRDHYRQSDKSLPIDGPLNLEIDTDRPDTALLDKQVAAFLAVLNAHWVDVELTFAEELRERFEEIPAARRRAVASRMGKRFGASPTEVGDWFAARSAPAKRTRDDVLAWLDEAGYDADAPRSRP